VGSSQRFCFFHSLPFLVCFKSLYADKLELWEFLNSVNEFYGSRIQILTSTSSEYKQMWLNARFSEAELADADIPCWLQSGNFGQAQKMETLIAFHLGESKERRRLSPFFPPPIYYQNPSCSMNCGWTHADCVETAIRVLVFPPPNVSQFYPVPFHFL